MILSDEMIRARMASGSLVLNGNTARATECSYSFRPGKAFPVQSSDTCIDFEQDKAATLTIKPGHMVWIRTREQVSMPEDLAGFWWQTNSLSKRGLMLVNMSMVEPIYKGDLACLFVNFGDQIIVIESETSIAKMVFMTINGAISSPHINSATRQHYDANLLQLAINQPPSFLGIGDLAHDLERQREVVLSSIEQSLNKAIEKIKAEQVDLVQNFRADMQSVKAEVISEFQGDAPKMVRKSIGTAAIGALILGLAIAISGPLQTYLFSDQRKLMRDEAEKAVTSRLSVPADVGDQRLAEIDKKLKMLEAKMEDRTSRTKPDE